MHLAQIFVPSELLSNLVFAEFESWRHIRLIEFENSSQGVHRHEFGCIWI